MIHFGAEGNLRYGLNFYPWRSRKTSIGFKIYWKWADTRYVFGYRYRPEFRDVLKMHNKQTKEQHDEYVRFLNM